MAQEIITYLPYQVIAPDALDNTFVIQAPMSPNKNEHTLVIEVVTGSIQFCVNQAVGANSPAYTAGSKFVFTIYGQYTDVYYKASAGSDSFIVGY